MHNYYLVLYSDVINIATAIEKLEVTIFMFTKPIHTGLTKTKGVSIFNHVDTGTIFRLPTWCVPLPGLS